MTSTRYGAGLSTSDIDMDSVAEWVTHCNQVNVYDNQWTDPKGTFTVGPATYDRFTMGAWLDTNETVATNIEMILNAGMASMTYDYRSGKFRVIPNRAMSTAVNTGPNESYTIFNFNETNIISDITVNSTDLYSLYNAAETSYPDFIVQDKAESLIVELDSSELLSNEPTSILSFDQPTVNFRPQAADIANITLKQSRIDQIVTLTGDFTTLGVDVGDFVSVTDKTKGWDTKYFRVKRTQERNNFGQVEINFVLQEYSDRPFERVIYQNADNDPFATGVGYYANYPSLNFGDESLDYTPVLANIYVADNAIQFGGQSNIINPATGVKIGNDTSGMPPGGFNGITDFDGENWLNVDYIFSGSDPDTFNRIYIDFDYQDTPPTHVSPATSNTRFVLDALNGAWNSDSSETIRLDKLTTGNYKISVSFSNNKGAVPEKISQVTQTADIFIDPRFPSVTTNGKLQGEGFSNTYGDDTHIDQYQIVVIPNSSSYTMRSPQLNHDICNAAPGTWTVYSNTTMTWSSTTGVADIGASTQGNVTFANQSNNESVCFQFNAGATEDSGNVAYMANSALKGNLVTTTTTFSTDPLHYGLDPEEYYATRCNVWLNAKVTNITSPSITWKYDIINKTPYYRH